MKEHQLGFTFGLNVCRFCGHEPESGFFASVGNSVVYITGCQNWRCEKQPYFTGANQEPVEKIWNQFNQKRSALDGP